MSEPVRHTLPVLLPDDRPHWSRRDFIKSVIATGSTVSGLSYFGAGAAGAVRQVGATERLLTLTVNGQERRVDVLPNETLTTTLRYKLGLTGTKLGCDRAECGACTVLIDDVPTYACSTLTHRVRSRDILTVSAVALLRTNPSPTRDEARTALSGNLCRCGAYEHYLNGVMRAAQEA